ncbi:MAG: hypothetical protein PHI35_00825, partial [Victivallaceae bacterium]|nr:hypothetical protein [Victivallaceae bacterium]
MSDDTTAAPLGFFRSLAGVCVGVEVFPRLIRHGWLRTLSHLFIMTFLCAAGVTVGESSRMSAALGGFGQEFDAYFGKVALANGSATPKKSPERARSIQFMPDGRLFYVPDW